MKQRLSAWAKRQVALHWRHPFVERIGRYCYTFIHLFENNDFDPATNGEFALLAALPDPRVVFDVGANVGDWTRQAARAQPSAQVHAFEIVPATFLRLRERTSHLSNVTASDCGLLDASGPVAVHCYEDSSMATIHAYPDRPSVTVSARALTGDEYCRLRGIERIDFLKLDVEGAELRVLAGLSGLLEAGGVRAIQFEYALINEVVGLPLYRFYELLEPLGYRIGKIHPNGVRFLSFQDMIERFRFGNFLAVKRDDTLLMDRLRRFPP